jgi:hypothetical protein
MKRQFLAKARRPVPSARVAQSARVLPSRACFARTKALIRLTVRGFALPGRDARHCSPPTSWMNKNLNSSALRAGPSLCQGRLSSYGYESYIHTVETGILLPYRRNHLGAAAPTQSVELRPTEAQPNITASLNRYQRSALSLQVPTERRCASLAGAASLCCQGSAPVSPPPLTAAAFRPVLRLGSGFGKIKAVASFSHTQLVTMPMQRTAVATNLTTHLPELYRDTVRMFDRGLARSFAIGRPARFLFAFSVALLASPGERPNISRRVLLSGVAGLILGALAAASGCVQVLRIFFLLPVRPPSVGCPWSWHRFAIRCPSGKAVHFVTRNPKWHDPGECQAVKELEQYQRVERTTNHTQ